MGFKFIFTEALILGVLAASGEVKHIHDELG